MASKINHGPYSADFAYSKGDIADFEKLYSQKKELSPKMRILFGILGLAGIFFFGWTLYKEGFDFSDPWKMVAYIGWLVISGILLMMAVHRDKGPRADDTVAKYKKYYTGRRVKFSMDDEGIEMHLEKQKNYSKSPWKKVHGLFETDRNWYITVKNKAYYIINKKAVTGGSPEEFQKYVEHQTGKKFIHHDVSGQQA